jgi:hypothetical protein
VVFALVVDNGPAAVPRFGLIVLLSNVVREEPGGLSLYFNIYFSGRCARSRRQKARSRTPSGRRI